MKSRFYLAIIIAGILPLAGVGAFNFYTLMNAPVPAPVTGALTSGASTGEVTAAVPDASRDFC